MDFKFHGFSIARSGARRFDTQEGFVGVGHCTSSQEKGIDLFASIGLDWPDLK
jgi:hypothetical protein